MLRENSIRVRRNRCIKVKVFVNIVTSSEDESENPQHRVCDLFHQLPYGGVAGGRSHHQPLDTGLGKAQQLQRIDWPDQLWAVFRPSATERGLWMA